MSGCSTATELGENLIITAGIPIAVGTVIVHLSLALCWIGFSLYLRKRSQGTFTLNNDPSMDELDINKMIVRIDHNLYVFPCRVEQAVVGADLAENSTTTLKMVKNKLYHDYMV